HLSVLHSPIDTSLPYTTLFRSYRLANRNFEEMVMGYEMKHGSIVQADGSLNLARVEQLITAAQETNMALYGHTLCWHSGQNAARSEEHTSELQSRENLVCRLLL